jgi:glyoxylase-like metal-dependent hydrolase (beta-lactamase superfamily II)
VPEVVETERHAFQVLPAPGHCDDQVVLYEPAQGWLFSGDAFLASRIKYFRADEDFGQTVASLRRLTGLSFEALFCAHRPVLQGGREALQRKLDQLVSLEQEVRALHARGLPVREISRRVLGPEDFFFLLTAGDVSRRNVVRAILYGPVPRRR